MSAETLDWFIREYGLEEVLRRLKNTEKEKKAKRRIFKPYAKWNDTYFRLEEANEDTATWVWRCTHGGWSIECDFDGTVTNEWLERTGMNHLRDFKLDTYFTESEYMEEFGKENKYE